MTPEIRVAPGFGARELAIEWHIEPDPRFSTELTAERLLEIFDTGVAAGCFGPGGAVERRTRRESIGRGELVRGTLRLPPSHAVAIKCLGRIAKCANRTLSFSAVEAGGGPRVEGSALDDAMPLDEVPAWAAPPPGHIGAPGLLALAAPPNGFSQKFVSLRVVVAEGEEERAAEPLERALRAWGELLGVGAFPFDGGGSNGWVDGFHNLFEDEFTATLEAVATDALGFQCLLMMLRHFETTVCAVRSADVR